MSCSTLALALMLTGPAAAPLASAEVRFDRRRIATQRAGMGVLTGWALANIGVVGSFAAAGTWRYVHPMNALWT